MFQYLTLDDSPVPLRQFLRKDPLELILFSIPGGLHCLNRLI